MTFYLILLSIVFILFISLHFIFKYVRYKSIIKESLLIINSHSTSLGRERYLNSFTDPYGIRRYEKWNTKGINYFFTKVFLPSHSARSEIDNSPSIKAKIYKLIELASIENEFIQVKSNLLLNGEDYESFCERILLNFGWRVIRTPRTGDFGVDLVAESRDLRVCIQCKKYSKPVGNSAVQEVVAGMAHYQGTHAVVVSNNSFTKKTRELASSNDVVLLNDSQLYNLIKYLR